MFFIIFFFRNEENTQSAQLELQVPTNCNKFKSRIPIKFKSTGQEKIPKTIVQNKTTSFRKENHQSNKPSRIPRANIKKVNDLEKIDKHIEALMRPDEKVTTDSAIERLDKGKERPSSMLKVLNHLLRNKYMKEFNLKNSELDVIFAFYNRNKSGVYLEISCLENFLNLTIKKRKEVVVDRGQIKKSLSALDMDKDKKLNLDEFIHLLVLFFADKKNLKTRIISILENLSVFHKSIGHLTLKEACEFEDFMAKFYGKPLKRSIFVTHNLAYHEFAYHIAPSLEPFLFVKW